MASKHTPGPWLMERPVGMQDPRVYADGGRRLVATAGNGERDLASLNRHEADARLIAAAPELLDALKAVYDALGKIDDYGSATGENPDVQNRALDMAEAALAKVEGGET